MARISARMASREASGSFERPDRDIHLTSDAGLEHVGDCRLVQPLPSHVGDHADDGFPRILGAWVEPVLQALADGILVRPETSRHFFVDDDDLRSARRKVALLEQPAAEQRDAHRLEESRYDLILGQRRRGILLALGRLSFERHAIVGLTMNEEVADRANGDDAWESSDPTGRLGVKRGDLRGVVVRARKVDLQEQHVAGIESSVRRLDSLEAADEEARS